METVQIVCGNCNARLKAPAPLPAGKTVKCPKCNHNITIAAVATNGTSRFSGSASVEVDTKSCPYCSEIILADAKKCRYCGEFLETGRKAAPKPRSRRAAASTEEMNPAEYFVATILFPAGFLIGLFWQLRGQRKALDMLKVSALSAVICLVGFLIYWQYFINKPGALPMAHDFKDDPTRGGYAGRDPNSREPEPNFGDPDDETLRALTKRPAITAPNADDLARQPADIQRAMRATVCVQVGPGIGTGVIVQRDGNTALVITNRHVVDMLFAVTHGRAQISVKQMDAPTVKFVTGDEKPGKIVWLAGDEVDLAMIQVQCPEGVAVANWQETPDIKIGDQVFAVGNPSGLGWTTTFGKISAFRDHEFGTRKVPVVQTDTRIGPGNSGGGLYTQSGILIGINTFVVATSRGNAGETGLGFAVRQSVLFDLKPAGLKLPATVKKPQ